MIAEVEVSEEPEFGIRKDGNGTQALARLEDGKRVGVVVSERYAGQTGERTLGDLSRALIAAWGTDYGVHNPTWDSPVHRYDPAGGVLPQGTCAAGRRRRTRALSPVGGQGLNIGVQDAVNLGWKLAQVVNQISPDSLLDTYHAERHPVAARVLRTTGAAPLTRSDARIDALRDTMTELLSMDEPRKRFGARMSGLDIHYDLGEGHPLSGPHARSLPGQRRRPAAGIHPAARRPAGAAQPRRARRP